MTKKIIVTGGAGFIGCNFVKKALACDYQVIVLDKLTYSGDLKNLEEVASHPNYKFYQGDINDAELVSSLFEQYHPISIINFAAETHVDNSIEGPAPFITTNVNGVFNLLTCALNYYQKLSTVAKANFKFIQISTDEVYGSLNYEDPPFSSKSQYAPNSPYSASKAAGDHLARAWFQTYNLPVIITNCSNNYGPHQHKEKLIPKTIHNALNGIPIPIYSKGENSRDWIYVEDHVDGVLLALEKGKAGEKYLFGGENEVNNLWIANKLCSIIKDLTGIDAIGQITFVTDRLGHDFRYAIDANEAEISLGFKPKHKLEQGLIETVKWYIATS